MSKTDVPAGKPPAPVPIAVKVPVGTFNNTNLVPPPKR